jgi:uncharacterized protein
MTMLNRVVDPIEPWIQTASGGKFHFLDPKPEDVRIEDIAIALANVCRFSGQIPGGRFLSVAQHSVAVMTILPRPCTPRERLLALLHDAAEAYLGDFSRPLKSILRAKVRKLSSNVGSDYDDFIDIRELEDKVQETIHRALGIQPPTSQEARIVKHCDNVMLVTEARDLGLLTTEWTDHPDNGSGIRPLDGTLRFWDPLEARTTFLTEYHRAVAGDDPIFKIKDLYQ